VLVARPERVIITEGVTDCISLMEHGFPVVSPVTVQIREADWERLLPKLSGVKTRLHLPGQRSIRSRHAGCAEDGAHPGTARKSRTRVAVLPLGDKAAGCT